MRTIRRTVLALIIVVAATLGLQAPASAVLYDSGRGYYGGITPYKVTNYNQPVGSYIHPGLLVGGPALSRSYGSAGAQKVVVLYHLTRLHSNGFTSTESYNYSYWLGAGVTKIPDFKLSVGAFGGTFHVRIAVAWHDAYDRWLGSRALAYNGSTNDYTCTYSHYVGCQVHTGWITIR